MDFPVSNNWIRRVSRRAHCCANFQRKVSSVQCGDNVFSSRLCFTVTIVALLRRSSIPALRANLCKLGDGAMSDRLPAGAQTPQRAFRKMDT